MIYICANKSKGQGVLEETAVAKIWAACYYTAWSWYTGEIGQISGTGKQNGKLVQGWLMDPKSAMKS